MLIFLVSGCKSGQQPDTAQAQPAASQQKLCGDWPSVWPKELPLKGGLSIHAESKIPAWWPSDISLHSKSKIIGVPENEAAVKMGKGGTMFLCSDSDVKSVFDFYNGYSENDWTINGGYNPSLEVQSLYGLKGSGETGVSGTVSVTIFESSEKAITIIQYIKS